MKKKTGPKLLPKELRRKRITITLLPRYHKLAAGHSSPGTYVEHCISLARLISNEQLGLLVEQMQKTNRGVDVLVASA